VNRALTKKLIYVIAAIAMLAMLIPAMAVPVGADNTHGHLNMVLYDPLTQSAQTTPDSGYNVSGSKVIVTAVPDNGYSIGAWNLRNVASEPNTQPATWYNGTPAPGATSAMVEGVWSDDKVEVSINGTSGNDTLSIEKKWGQIAYTDISGSGFKPVVWNELNKTWSANATIGDTVYGAFYEKDIVNANTGSHILVHTVQGVILNWYLVAGNVAVPMASGEAAALKPVMGDLGKPSHVTFANYTGNSTFTRTVSDANGASSIMILATGEEAVQVVIVPEYPFGEVNIPVTPERATYDFYTTEAEVVPQVRWAGEKIVLEKNFGGTGWVKFTLQNQSVGSLEGITGRNNNVNSEAVWTQIGADGFASCILTSSDTGVSQVSAGWYSSSDNSTLINQHYFTIYWLKLESITIGDVKGKREFHNSGLWQLPSTVVPTNPWDPTGSYNGASANATELADSITQNLNVSQDALVRARVKGWFTSSNPSTRLERKVDYNNSTLDNPQTAQLTLPVGRWILPDDWATLAGPNWTQGRIHWDIMCDPYGAITATNALGIYYTNPLANPLGVAHSGDNVIGPFSPGLELMTPTGWQIPNPNFDPNNRNIDTVVPDGNLDYWDAPMPPAKVIFQIQNVTAADNISKSVGYFKAASKTDIYYVLSGATKLYTNPFYQEMVPAHQAIPAFINNGGYDWNSFDRSYGAYMFWEFINQHLYAPLVPTTDPSGHPTNVEVYSDNHGEAMVWLNGNWNLDLTYWSAKGYADIPINTTVGMTTVQATADYPYSRVHQALQSNKDVKTWWWGGQVLGTDSHQFGHGITTLTADTRLVLSAGNYDSNMVGTRPNQAAASDDKVVWVWVTDRDGLQTGVEGAQVTWLINDGTQAKINDGANGWLSEYNEVTQGIFLGNGFNAAENGFLRGTNGHAASSILGYSTLRKPTDMEKTLFNKFWGNPVAISGTTIGTSSIRANPNNYCVAAIDLLDLMGGGTANGRVNVTISITSHDFDAVQGQSYPATVVYNTNVDFGALDALDDGIRVGDANYDGVVNMGDVTAVERMILGYNRVATNAILNNDGTVDMGTVVKIERKILGLP